MLALGEGNVESARVLLAAEKDADVNRRSRAGCSLLALAAKGGCVELMQPLIRAKADVNAQDRQKYSVLSHAWQPAAVKLLVDAKADLNPRHSCVLRSACRRLEPEAVRMLLVAGARVNGPHPCTSLYNAIGALPEPGREHDKAQVVRALLEAKATLIPAAGQSLLHYCAYLDSAGGMAEVIRVLLAREPSQRDGRDDEHRTPLMLAAQTLHEDAVVELARAGADPNAVDAAGVSVLAHAVHACDAARQYGPAHKVLRALIAAGADPLACDAAGLSVPMRMLEADLGRVDVDREDDDVLDVVLQLFVELAAENLGLDPV
jgi:ankyrin repeat protein